MLQGKFDGTVNDSQWRKWGNILGRGRLKVE